MNGSIEIDFSVLWTWVLLFVRTSAMLTTLPGIGTDQVPVRFRTLPALCLAFCYAFGGHKAQFPAGMAEGGLMIFSEFTLGFLLGAIPAYTLVAASSAGHAIAGSIGLSQANMIDQSLGESAPVVGRIQSLVGTIVFLLMDGHHIVLRAIATSSETIGIGNFLPDASTAFLLVHRFIDTFALAAVIAAPILVASLFTQFVLGLLTKFVPQINVFIMSMPLTLLVGLFILKSLLPEVAKHMLDDFGRVEGLLSQLISQQ